MVEGRQEWVRGRAKGRERQAGKDMGRVIQGEVQEGTIMLVREIHEVTIRIKTSHTERAKARARAKEKAQEKAQAV